MAIYLYSFSTPPFLNSVDREKFYIFAFQLRQPVIFDVIMEYMKTKEAGSSTDIPDLFPADVDSNLIANTILN